MNIFSKIVFIFTSLFLVMSCGNSKQGSTSSKIKLVGANLFSGGLGSKANNGLILYGTSASGKSFAKKIDSDTIDLIFPNDKWNFYAVAWEHGSPNADTGLQGVVSCGKLIGVQLNGSDASINLKLSNANCDMDFHPGVESVLGVKKLAKLSLFSCKNFTGASTFVNSLNTSCDQTIASPNKGYATSFKLVVPEYSSFGGLVGGGEAISSQCMGVRPNSSTASLDVSAIAYAAVLNFPRIGLNGFEAYLKVYYSSNPCVESTGFTTISLGQSTKKKLFSDAPAGAQVTDQYFVETDASAVCQGPRLSSVFASGKGTTDLPYTLCTKQQFENIQALYMTPPYYTKHSSFDLLTNIDFNYSNVAPVGNGTDAYIGHFNGNEHSLSKFRIACDLVLNENYVALFRMTGWGSRFSNLVIDDGGVDCYSGTANQYVGLLVGKAIAADFSNIKVFSSYVDTDPITDTDVGNLSGSIGTATYSSIDYNTNPLFIMGGLESF